MANCRYVLKGVKYNSYTELIDFLENLILDLRNVSDIVYSKTLKLQLQVERLLKLKREYKPKISQSLVDGEPSINGTSILDFLDSPEFVLNERRILTPFNRDNYINETVNNMKKDPLYMNNTEELNRAIVEETIKHWDIIQEDSLLIHSMLTDNTIPNPNSLDIDFINNYKDLIKNTRLSPTLMKLLFIGLKNNFYLKEKGKYNNSLNFSNVNLASKIKDSNLEIFGHIDHLFVGEDGTLHLYLFKITSENPKDWANVKQEKYKYQLAFLKQMLSNNGINVKNIDLNIVPILLSYNDNFSNIQSIKVLNTISYSTRYYSSEYSMAKYDKQVSSFIESNTNFDYIPTNIVERADTVNRAIFPELNIKDEGYLGQSARMWIARAPNIDPTGTEPLVISQTDDGYNVFIEGKLYKITSKVEKNKNKEIIDLISKYVTKLEDYKGYSTLRLKDAIKNSYKKGFLTLENGFESSTRRLNSVLEKYFSDYTEINGIKDYKWELLDDLIDANVLIFRNKSSKVIDIISISSFNLKQEVTFNKGTNLLGSYRYDISNERSELKNNFGDIEAVRAMELLNEMIPELLNSGESFKLGTLGVLSTVGNGEFKRWDLGQFNRDYFNNIIKVVNKENPNLKIENNFKKVTFTDPINTILEEYSRIMEGKSEFEQNKLNLYGFDLLTDAKTKDLQIKSLLHIMLLIYDGGYKIFSDPKEVQKALLQKSGTYKEMALLLNLVTKAYLNLTGESPKYQKNLQPIDLYLFTAITVPDPNILIVVNNLLITHDAISSEFLQRFDRSIFDNYYEKIGYTNLLNMTIGNLALLFKNLFEIDLYTGKRTMSFKNPYDYNNDLTSDERELLKKVLYLIAWINTNGNFKYTSYNDPKLPLYIKEHSEYLWVPLIRASKATSRLSLDAIKTKMRDSFRRLKNATERFDEFVNGITPEERELIGNSDDFYKLRLKNPFELSMPSSNSGIPETIKSRERLIQNHGIDFFETNVENILIEFLIKHISTTLFNKMLIGTKALLLLLHLTGDYGGNSETTQKEIDWILKYLKVNVFNTSIMSDQEKKIIGCILPIKTIVSHMLIGGNVVGAIRDTIEGAQLNFIRSIIKLNTDLKPKYIVEAYAYVTKHSTSDAMAVNLLSKLCLKYRLSNTDVGRISERAKTARNGIFNYDNWLYSTLRGPDFINRMTLFVARCMLDGVWDAFSIDENNNLVYDWKKDSRFSIYAQGLTEHSDYKKHKQAYFSAIRLYNTEHSDSPINPDDGLPSPYSDLQILYIRNLADNIYGSYDLGKRSMMENVSLGIVFGMFSTWFNGIVNNYFMKPLKNGAFGLEEIQETDEQGRLLFFNEDGNITYENTGLKVLKYVPVIVQGIFPMLGTLIDIFKKSEGVSKGIKSIRDYLNSDQHEKANMRKLLSDLLMWLLYWSLFKFAITPLYKEYKKNMQEKPLLANMFTELLYKGSSRSYDLFKGPINILLFVGENMNPPTYSLPTQLISDTVLFLVGDKSFLYLLFNCSGFTRSFKDSGISYIKSIL